MITKYDFDVILASRNKGITSKIQLKLLLIIKEFDVFDRENKILLKNLPMNINNSSKISEDLYLFLSESKLMKVVRLT